MLDFSNPYIPDDRIVLQKDPHRWTLDDQPAPGITEILSYAGWIGEWGATEEQKRDGHNLHVGIALSVDGSLDFDHFKATWPHLVGKLEAGRRALEFFKVKPGWVEIFVCCRRRWVCTAIDAIGTIEDQVGTINWKSGDEQDWHSIQTAGEHAMFFQDDYFDFEQKTFRASVKLEGDGTFDFGRDVKLYTDVRDFDLFDAACVTAEGMKRKGRGRPEPKARKAKVEKVIEPVPVESTMFESVTPKVESGGLF